MEHSGGNSYQCGGEGGEEEEEEKASEEKDEKKQTCVDQEDGPEPCDNGDDDGGHCTDWEWHLVLGWRDFTTCPQLNPSALVPAWWKVSLCRLGRK